MYGVGSCSDYVHPEQWSRMANWKIRVHARLECRNEVGNGESEEVVRLDWVHSTRRQSHKLR